VVQADGSGERRLTDTPGANYEADWSPRNNRIVFTSTRNGGPPQIYVMNADGSGATRLTDTPPYDGARQPMWSPDGTRIAFVREENIWTMNADGTSAARLTRRDGYTAAHHPAWSPDGSLIVFSADNDFGIGSEYALAFADAVTGTERYGVFEYRTTWSPTGKRSRRFYSRGGFWTLCSVAYSSVSLFTTSAPSP
jgi:Tol biopolymer transport system component